MFRTRDFILFFTTAVFLVMAIGVTWFTGETDNPTQVPSATTEIAEVSAVVTVAEDTSLTRAERLALLREKIAQSELITISEPEDVIVSPSTTPDFATSSVALASPLLCPSYQTAFVPDWPTQQIEVVTVEGVRQYFTVTTETVTVGTTTSEAVTKDVKLELPVSQFPLGQTACLTTDVIGVATDGSLIRNTETGLYAIFSNETLIGYALDGFPIFGSGILPTDGCGGRLVGGQYRYELSTDRSTILNCFAGTPRQIQ